MKFKSPLCLVDWRPACGIVEYLYEYIEKWNSRLLSLFLGLGLGLVSLKVISL